MASGGKKKPVPARPGPAAGERPEGIGLSATPATTLLCPTAVPALRADPVNVLHLWAAGN
ncbi:MAG: hypothetical protein RMK29_04090 [Myxococcales bacterium]|nr:hypothetical protein [Myxococcota bacterium]MDW8280867.1 hypothetical protein [Myxococcales bacterium]